MFELLILNSSGQIYMFVCVSEAICSNEYTLYMNVCDTILHLSLSLVWVRTKPISTLIKFDLKFQFQWNFSSSLFSLNKWCSDFLESARAHGIWSGKTVVHTLPTEVQRFNIQVCEIDMNGILYVCSVWCKWIALRYTCNFLRSLWFAIIWKNSKLFCRSIWLEKSKCH